MAGDKRAVMLLKCVMNHFSLLPRPALSLILAATLALSACAKTTPSPQDQFFDTLSQHCGKAFAGQLVSNDDADADFKSKSMVMEVRDCSDTVIKIPFHVDEDRSRTWVISKTANGLRLKHDHRHEDGSEDVLTQYGGDTQNDGTALRQEFPADDFSKALFTKENIPVSNANIWAVEVSDQLYVYELKRPNRHFRVEFDLTKEVSSPPAPWGH